VKSKESPQRPHFASELLGWLKEWKQSSRGEGRPSALVLGLRLGIPGKRQKRAGLGRLGTIRDIYRSVLSTVGTAVEVRKKLMWHSDIHLHKHLLRCANGRDAGGSVKRWRDSC
jgi:hypothetical protein